MEFMKVGPPYGSAITVTDSSYVDKEKFVECLHHFQYNSENNTYSCSLIIDGHSAR